jgi:hypothetical protein
MAAKSLVFSISKTSLSLHSRLLALVCFFIFLAPFASKSQYFTLGTDPASVKWNKIKTEHFTVIFPKEFTQNAQYIANGFEHVFLAEGHSLNAWPKRFPVILHNRSVYSNAFVPYAPKRIEFLTVGPQDNYAQDWIDQIIVHEFRHAVQYASINRGFTKAMGYLFGQQAVPLVIGLFAPMWFIEGDATIIETACSASGRGRLPSFEMKLKAQFIEKGIYNYDKAVHGSFKDFIPNRYELGYQLVGRTRVENGREVWAKTMATVGRYPFMVVPFSHSLKKQTGKGKVQLYRHITDKMQVEWVDADEVKELTGFLPLTTDQRVYTDYRMPVVMRDGTVIAIKQSLDDITRIVRISPDGDEIRLFTPGTGFFADALSASDSLVCWGEAVADPRWSLSDYAVVKTYNFKTGKISQRTHHTRYFAPAISRQGDRIVAVEVTKENMNYLVILDAMTGEEMQRTGTLENLFPMQPAWSEDGERIVCVVLGKHGKSLMTWEPGTGTTTILLPFYNIEISHPSFFGSHIIYSGGYDGTDDLYALYLPTGQVLRITASRFGAAGAAMQPSAESIVYADYTAEGYRIAVASLESELWRPQSPGTNTSFPLAEALAAQENFLYIQDSVPEKEHPVKKYRKGLNMFNFHSWAPLSFNVDNMTLNPGAMLLSQNLLGTSYTTLGYEYNLNEEAGKYYFNYTYTGLYPAFDAGMDYGLRRGIGEVAHDSLVQFKYNELNAYGGISIPLNWSKNAWYLGFRPRVGYEYTALFMDPASSLNFKQDRVNSLEYRVFLYAQQKSAYRDLQPKWGQVLELTFMHTPFDSAGASNSMFSAEMVLYFPGLARHHGFKAYAGYQDAVSDYHRYPNQVSIVRGYSGVSADKMMTASVAYVFPLFYPDWRLGPVLYLKRLKGAVFYDHTILLDESLYDSFITVGLDLSVDFHLLSIMAPFEIGLRSMYFPGDQSMGFQLLWGLNIDSLY